MLQQSIPISQECLDVIVNSSVRKMIHNQQNKSGPRLHRNLLIHLMLRRARETLLNEDNAAAGAATALAPDDLVENRPNSVMTVVLDSAPEKATSQPEPSSVSTDFSAVSGLSLSSFSSASAPSTLALSSSPAPPSSTSLSSVSSPTTSLSAPLTPPLSSELSADQCKQGVSSLKRKLAQALKRQCKTANNHHNSNNNVKKRKRQAPGVVMQVSDKDVMVSSVKETSTVMSAAASFVNTLCPTLAYVVHPDSGQVIGQTILLLPPSPTQMMYHCVQSPNAISPSFTGPPNAAQQQSIVESLRCPGSSANSNNSNIINNSNNNSIPFVNHFIFSQNC